MTLYYPFTIVVSVLIASPAATISNSTGHGIFGNMMETIAGWIADFGYPSIFAAALLENLIPPIPSELVFPLAGFSAQINNLGMIAAIGMAIVGALGSTVGAIIIYFISQKIGQAAITRIGKRYRILSESDVEKAELWFEKHGGLAVFLGRMAPGIRELISIPAGIAEMNIIKFIFFTFIGSCIWSLLLTLIGFYGGEAWIRFYGNHSLLFDIIGISLILVLITIIIVRYFKGRQS